MNPQAIITQLKQYPVATLSGIVLLVLLGILGLRTSFAPDYQTQLEEAEERLQTIEANEDAARGLDQDIAEMREKIAFVEERLIDPQQPTPNKQYLLSMAQDYNVAMPDPRRGADPPRGKRDQYSILVYNVSLSGDFNQLLTFIKAASEGYHICNITEMSLSPAAGEGIDFANANLRLEFLAQPIEQ